MTCWLDRLETHMPDIFISGQIQILLLLTARIFKKKSRWVLFRSPEQALCTYAKYTRELMEEHTVRESVQKRMYELSFQTGCLLRKITRLHDKNQLARLIVLLYRNIGIEMQGNLPGTVVINRCYFLQFYTPQMCRQISSMDAGIVCGIFYGGEFQFTQRMTEGCSVCKAFLKQEEGEGYEI